MQHKPTLSRRTFMELLALTGLSMALPLPSSKADDPIETLAQTAFSNLTNDELMVWWKTYRSLNFEQLEEFSTLLGANVTPRLAAYGDKGLARIEAFRELRTEINQQAMRLHNLPFNQISFAQLNALLETIAADPHSASLRQQAAALAACACFDFPYTATPGGSGAPGNGQSYIAASQQRSDCGDCDWEVTYSFYRQTIHYTTPSGYGHYATVGSRQGGFILRRTPSTTKVVFGFWTTLFWQIDPWLLLWDFRLD